MLSLLLYRVDKRSVENNKSEFYHINELSFELLLSDFFPQSPSSKAVKEFVIMVCITIKKAK